MNVLDAIKGLNENGIDNMMLSHTAAVQALIGFIVMWIINRLKQWEAFKWLNPQSQKIELAVIIATGILIGGGFNYEHHKLEDGRTQLLLTIPTIGMLLHSGYQVLNQRLFSLFWRVKELETSSPEQLKSSHTVA